MGNILLGFAPLFHRFRGCQTYTSFFCSPHFEAVKKAKLHRSGVNKIELTGLSQVLWPGWTSFEALGDGRIEERRQNQGKAGVSPLKLIQRF
jgi:hypothetical protein